MRIDSVFWFGGASLVQPRRTLSASSRTVPCSRSSLSPAKSAPLARASDSSGVRVRDMCISRTRSLPRSISRSTISVHCQTNEPWCCGSASKSRQKSPPGPKRTIVFCAIDIRRPSFLKARAHARLSFGDESPGLRIERGVPAAPLAFLRSRYPAGAQPRKTAHRSGMAGCQ